MVFYRPHGLAQKMVIPLIQRTMIGVQANGAIVVSEDNTSLLICVSFGQASVELYSWGHLMGGP